GGAQFSIGKQAEHNGRAASDTGGSANWVALTTAVETTSERRSRVLNGSVSNHSVRCVNDAQRRRAARKRSTDLPGGIAYHCAAGGHVAYHIASEADQRFVSHVQSIHDAGTAADVAVLSDDRVSCDGDVGADQAPCPDRSIVMNDGIRQDA